MNILFEILSTQFANKLITSIYQYTPTNLHLYTYLFRHKFIHTKKDNSYLHNLLHIKNSLFKVLRKLEKYILKLYL